MAGLSSVFGEKFPPAAFNRAGLQRRKLNSQQQPTLCGILQNAIQNLAARSEACHYPSTSGMLSSQLDSLTHHRFSASFASSD